ncbi:MAG: diguanylate cyclase [Oscillospiraceae bacterium]|nr:diguanylate cyclase [Oscillospiraceae bacterium]
MPRYVDDIDYMRGSELDRIYDEESSEIENQWRRLHFNTMIFLSLVVVAVEILLSFLVQEGRLISIPPPSYCLKYIVYPAALYILVDISAFLLCKYARFDEETRAYIVSLAFALLCLAVCFFHSYFVVVYAGGVTAISLTTIYGNKRLTGVTTGVIVAGSLLFFLFDPWDADVVLSRTYIINVCLVIVIDMCIYVISRMIVSWEYKRRYAVVLRQFEMENEATRDQLTGVRNRRGLRQYIEQRKTNMTIALMDINNFKMANDRWGHTSGDGVLSTFGNILLSWENSFIAAFRYGGDEFLIVFTDCSKEKVYKVCEGICSEFVEAISPEMRDAGIGISFGVSSCGKDMEPSDAIRFADRDMYRSKRAEKARES